MGKKCNCKETVLDAAEAVVLQAGAGHMSLDTVARKAGVSKGGLMYHFPTKEALLKAMLERMIAQFYKNREQKLSELTPGPGQMLKAGIMASFDRSEKMDRMGLAILAAAAYDPELLQVLRQAHGRHLKELMGASIDFGRAAVASLASDGLMLLELLGVSPYSAAQKKKIKAQMLRLIDQEV